MMEKHWYVVHTYAGYENKVKENLEKRVESMIMTDFIFSILVPTTEETVHKDGKTKVVQKRLYPGYVMVEMVQTDDSWYVVRNTPGVTGFVGSTGSGSKPTPLKPDEVEGIFRAIGIENLTPQVDFELGEIVKITFGPFANFTGAIEEIIAEKHKLRVTVNMFGRETPVELDFTQVEKL
jgi:transcriptional antiterminator NusG